MARFALIIFLLFGSFTVTKAQPGKICNWDSDKQATVVLTFDDWSPGHYPIVVPELKKRDMVATFFPMISSIAEWNHPWPTVIEAVSYGNEMGNHSATHPKLSEATDEELSGEIRGAKQIIDENLSAQTVFSFDYPFGDYNNQVIDSVRSTGHICGRGVNSPNNYAYNFATTDKDYYELRTYAMTSSTTLEQFTSEIDKVASEGGLLIYMYHSVDDEDGSYNDNWYAQVLEEDLEDQFDVLKQHDNIWVTTLGQAVKYHREVNCATLSEVTPFDGKKWVLNLTDTLLDNNVYNQPLSLKIGMNGAGFNEVYQQDGKLTIDSIYGDTIQFKAIPDAGKITLNIAVRDTILASNEYIEYTGRIDFSDSLAPEFSFSGVSIRANFYGTSISAILDDDMNDNYYNVLLDGQVVKVIKVTSGKKEYILAEGLEDKLHEIELFKRTELTFGKTQFFGFTLDEEKTLAPIANKRELFIEYIGNSITCGYGNEGTSSDNFLAETENHFMTYAAITSRNFNARHMAVSRSGIGIYRNYDGPATGNDDCMPNLYNNVFLYDNSIKYNFAEQPDVVCINLGTNDFSTSGGDSALYVDNYFRLIDTIQSKYNMPEIVCLLGSMMSGNTLTEVRGYLKFVVDSASKKGKGNVSFFEMSSQTGDLGIGVHYHPTVAQHMRNASELTAYLKSLMDWEITPLALEVKTINAKQVQATFNVDLIQEEEDFTGISLVGSERLFTIEEIATEDANGHVLNLMVKENIEPNQPIYFNYLPGTISSVDSVELGAVINFNVANTLSETFITKAEVEAKGESIKLTFNKVISAESKIDGLSIRNAQGKLAIQSFELKGKYIILELSEDLAADEEVYAKYKGSAILGSDLVPLEEFDDFSVENEQESIGFESYKVEKQLSFWPNPNPKGQFYFQADNLKKADYQVYNHSGKLISEGLLTSKAGVLNFGEQIPGGVYFLKVRLNSGVETHKLIIAN